MFKMLAIELEWFLTIPGLLVSGGVLLLLIALIIFIASSVKSRKEKKRKQEFDNAIEANTFSVEQTVETPVESVNVATSFTEEVKAPSPSPLFEQMTKPVEPVMPTIAEEAPVVTPVVEVAPVVETTPFVVEPVMQTIAEETPVVTPVVEVAPVVETTPFVVEPAPFVVEPAPLEVPVTLEEPVMSTIAEVPQTETNAYGGTPVFTGTIDQPEHNTIYGGADPLEGTQSLNPIKDLPVEEVAPVVEPAVVLPPVVEQPVEVPTPVVTPVVVEPTTPVIPEIEEL